MNEKARDEIVIPLREAADEWANPSAVVVNGRTYSISVRYQERGDD